MYSKISIKNFRGIETLEAEGLRRINLIMGRNNCGKTTFLESLFLLGGRLDPQVMTALGLMRGQRLEGTLGLFRIDKRGDRHVMVAYSDEAMQGVREAPFEVRG